MPYITANKIDKAVMPPIQIMVLSCFIYMRNITDKKVYTFQQVVSFNYPTTFREVKARLIKKGCGWIRSVWIKWQLFIILRKLVKLFVSFSHLILLDDSFEHKANAYWI